MSGKNGRHALIRRAVKGRGFLAPRYSKAARRFLIAAGGIYLRFFEGVAKVRLFNEERITDAFEGFHNGDHRLIFVFRHPAEEDPPSLMYLFNIKLRRKIERRGKTSHVRFLYGRDVPNWAGPAAAWLFPRIGAIPVQNRGGNREALKILHREIREGRFPVALAPEEQVVYHMYKCFGLAPGISSLVRWGLESGKPVMVVPLAPGYTYDREPEAFIRRMLGRWEEETGISLKGPGGRGCRYGRLHPLLLEAADGTLAMLESFYGLPQAPEGERMQPEKLDERIAALCEAILSAAERHVNLQKTGSRMDRLFRIRYNGVDSFYPEDADPASLPLLPRALRDFKALEAETSIRHSQVIDVLEYIHMDYINPPFSSGRGCEFILNLLDLINRANGGNISGHWTPDNQHAAIYAGKPLIFSNTSHDGLSRREFMDKIKADVKTAMQHASEELEPQWEKVKLE